MQDNTAFRASIYVIYVVLLVCVFALCAGILDFRAVGSTGIPSVRFPSVDSHCVSPIGIHGKGDEQIYPLGIIPTPSCGETTGGLSVSRSICPPSLLGSQIYSTP